MVVECAKSGGCMYKEARMDGLQLGPVRLPPRLLHNLCCRMHSVQVLLKSNNCVATFPSGMYVGVGNHRPWQISL